MSPNRSLVVAVVVGAIVGGASFVGWRLAADDTGDAAPEVTTSTRPVTVEAPWVEGGIRYETTVIVPVTFAVENGVAELVYRAETIGPAFGRDEAELPAMGHDVLVRPERWLLELEGGESAEATTDAEDGRVRFEVPEGTTVADVAAVHVVGWRRAVAVGSTVTLPLETGAAAGFGDGTELTMRTVLDQATSTIIQVEVSHPDDPWHGAGGFLIARSPDVRWRLSGGSAGGFQMTWQGDDAPDEIVLEQTYPVWVSEAARTTIIGGAS